MSDSILDPFVGSGGLNADEFTGTDPSFVPPRLPPRPWPTPGEKVALPRSYHKNLIRPLPPSMPGVNPNGEYHFAQGMTSGPMYVSKTILGKDPIWIRLAYIRYPIGRRDLRELLSPYTARGPGDPGEITPELEAVRAMDGMLSNARIREDAAYRQFALGPFRVARTSITTFTSQMADRNPLSLLEIWRVYQWLTMATLWVYWAGAPLDFARWVTSAVGDVYDDSRHSRAVLWADKESNPPPGKNAEPPVDLEAMQKWGDAGVSLWETVDFPKSVAAVFSGLHGVIGKAGVNVWGCFHCRRLFERGRRGQRYCSDLCRWEAFSLKKKNRKGGGPPR